MSALPFPTRASGWKTTGILLCALAYLGMTYFSHIGVWTSAAVTLFILACMRLTWPGNWLEFVGLRLTPVQWRRTFTGLLLVVCTALTVIYLITLRHDIDYAPYLVTGLTVWFLFPVFQALNEEIILGSMLLKGLRRRAGGLHPMALVLAGALVFALGHLAFYLSLGGGALSLAALLSLFAVGLIRNHVILATGHIGYIWALHLGWNAVFFGALYQSADTGDRLSRVEMFNLVMGDPAFVVFITCLTLLSFRIWKYRRTERPA